MSLAPFSISGVIMLAKESSYSSLMSMPCARYMVRIYSLLFFMLSTMLFSYVSSIPLMRSLFCWTSFTFYSEDIFEISYGVTALGGAVNDPGGGAVNA